MTVQDLMTVDPISVQVTDTLQRAAEKMERHNVGIVCVLAGSRLVGVITDRDLTVRAGAQDWRFSEHVCGDVMTPNPIRIKPDADVLEAAELIGQHHVRRLPVCEGNRLVGLISAADLADYTQYLLRGILEEERKAEKALEPERPVPA
ncbi:MAG: CBS domain-containing protein [Armatimonadetes bacterium]|nr:CBS domain-containing protein [Armatimonadota bacterium]